MLNWQVSQSNPYPYLNAGKVMVMPSAWEGFGLAAVEGMCLGKPVVCSGVGGLADIVDENLWSGLQNDRRVLQRYPETAAG